MGRLFPHIESHRAAQGPQSAVTYFASCLFSLCLINLPMEFIITNIIFLISRSIFFFPSNLPMQFLEICSCFIFKFLFYSFKNIEPSFSNPTVLVFCWLYSVAQHLLSSFMVLRFLFLVILGCMPVFCGTLSVGFHQSLGIKCTFSQRELAFTSA